MCSRMVRDSAPLLPHPPSTRRPLPILPEVGSFHHMRHKADSAMPPHRRKGGATPTRRRGRPTPPTPSTFHGSRHASRPGLQAAQRATPRRWQIAAGGSARRQPAAPPFPGEPEPRRPSLPRESADDGGVRSENGVAGGGRFRCGWVRAILPFPHRHCAAAATPLETGGSQCGHDGGAYRRSAAAPAAAAADAAAHAVCLKPRAYNFCARRPSWGREGLAAAVPLSHARPCLFHLTRVVGVSRGLGAPRPPGVPGCRPRARGWRHRDDHVARRLYPAGTRWWTSCH